MPTCRRKRVVLTEPSDLLHHALKSDPDKEVYYLEQTGEIFETYECAHPVLTHFLPSTLFGAIYLERTLLECPSTD